MTDVSTPQPCTRTTTLLLGGLPGFITRRNRSASIPPPLNLESTEPSPQQQQQQHPNQQTSSLLTPGSQFTSAARPLIRRFNSSGSSITRSSPGSNNHNHNHTTNVPPSTTTTTAAPPSSPTSFQLQHQHQQQQQQQPPSPSPNRSIAFSNMLRRSTRRDSNPASNPNLPPSSSDIPPPVPILDSLSTTVSPPINPVNPGPIPTNTADQPHLSHPPTSVSHPNPSLPPGTIHRIRLVPHLESTRSIPFEPIIRDAIENGPVIRVGRFTDRVTGGNQGNGSAPNAPNALKIAFRSKVVSRGHAEIWVEEGGKFFIRDTKSSSGTFLNHIRLANANVESRPFPLKDGDVIQLGIDYQGGQQEIYRCVKIKVEIGREWQTAANTFNTNALRRLNNLGVHSVLPSSTLAPPPHLAATVKPSYTSHPDPPTTTTTTTTTTNIISTDPQANSTDCCICLFPITVCQALFIAPCSHAFHYKCMRPMLVAHHPGFSCPLCRTFADLESDVEVDYTGYDKTGVVGGGGIGQMVSAGDTGAGRPNSDDAMALEELGLGFGPGGGVPQAIPEEDEGVVENESAANESGGEGGSGQGRDLMVDDVGDEVEAMVTSENERGVVRGETEGVEMDREEEDEEAEVEGHVNSRSVSVASDAVARHHQGRDIHSTQPRGGDEPTLGAIDILPDQHLLQASALSSAYDDARSNSFSDADAEGEGDDEEDEEQEEGEQEEEDVYDEEKSGMEVDEDDEVDGVEASQRRMRTRSMRVGVGAGGVGIGIVVGAGSSGSGSGGETSRMIGAKRKRRTHA